jgi:hypothetical protein
LQENVAMPRPDYLPRRDADFLAFAQNFAGQVSADPAALGLSGSDVGALAVLCDAFVSAFAASRDPMMRTRGRIAAKDSARALLAAEMRALARRIGANLSVSDAQRIELGLTPRSAVPVYSGPPRTRPLLSVRPLRGNRARVRLSDAQSPTHRGKPPGAVGAVLLIRIGAGEGSAEGAFAYAGLATKAIHTIQLPRQAVSQEVWITARWFNLRGEEGPQAAAARTIGVG